MLRGGRRGIRWRRRRREVQEAAPRRGDDGHRHAEALGHRRREGDQGRGCRRARGDVQRARPGRARERGAPGGRARLHREAVQAGRRAVDAHEGGREGRVGVDLAKYRALFLEEAAEHLAEMSRACLALEKDPENAEAIDLVFRTAHSIKGMAASLDYDSVTQLAHRLEDRMAAWRAQGRVDVPEGMQLLFRGLEGLERAIGVVQATGESPPPDTVLLEELGRKKA